MYMLQNLGSEYKYIITNADAAYNAVRLKSKIVRCQRKVYTLKKHMQSLDTLGAFNCSQSSLCTTSPLANIAPNLHSKSML